jgi:hypothetical protein
MNSSGQILSHSTQWHHSSGHSHHLYKCQTATIWLSIKAFQVLQKRRRLCRDLFAKGVWLYLIMVYIPISPLTKLGKSNREQDLLQMSAPDSVRAACWLLVFSRFSFQLLKSEHTSPANILLREGWGYTNEVKTVLFLTYLQYHIKYAQATGIWKNPGGKYGEVLHNWKDK